MADSPQGMKPGSMQGQIKTPMTDTQVAKKNDPGIHSFASTWHDGSGSSKGQIKTGDEIMGPGNKGSWRKK